MPPPTQAPTGKQLALLFLHQSRRKGEAWTCDECHTEVRQGGSGYSNLCTHVRIHHEKVMHVRSQEALEKKLKLFKGMAYDSKTLRVHAWLEIIIVGLFPFSFCEKEIVRKNFQHGSLCRNTLMKYAHRLVNKVEKKISDVLLSKLALIFDGWSAGDTHYVAIIATYPSRNKKGYDAALLACSPMENEDDYGANEHFEFVRFVLSVFNKSLDNVVAIIGDNCSTNRSLSRMVGRNFIGFHSHRYNLAVRDIMQEHSSEILKVKQLMQKLTFPIPAAKLRRLTPLKANKSNDTRWSSCSEMLKRFNEILPFIKKLDLDDIQDAIPTELGQEAIKSLCKQLGALESVTKELQRDSITLAEERVLFDAVISKHATTSSRLSPTASIVENQHFECAIVKIQAGEESTITPVEKRVVSNLKLRVESQDHQRNEPAEKELNFAQQALKRRCVSVSQSSRTSCYMDLRFILPTSNMCERLFSVAGYALEDRRKGVLPSNFECQLFLNYNARFWDVNDVHDVLHN